MSGSRDGRSVGGKREVGGWKSRKMAVGENCAGAWGLPRVGGREKNQ